MPEVNKERAVLLIGENPLRQVMNGDLPHVAIGVDISWDDQAMAWRAEWEGGIQFGATQWEAIINGLRQRLGLTDAANS